MARKQRKNKSRKKPLPGEALELAVARVQQLLDTDARVTQNEKIIDRLGHERQCDVVIRGTFGGRPMLGIIECKDHGRKKGLDAVEAFAKKTEHLGANLRMMVSRKGFTRSALKLAAFEHIGCLSLLRSDSADIGLHIGHLWYGVSLRWTDPQLIAGFRLRRDQPTPICTPYAVLWQGKPVIRWLLRELLDRFDRTRKPGAYELRLAFQEPVTMDFGGVEYDVTNLMCRAQWVQTNKRRWVDWSGEALYDWHTERVTVPPNVNVVLGPIDSDLTTWDDYDREIVLGPDDSTNLSHTFIMVFTQPPIEGPDIPDLGPLGTVTLERIVDT